MSPPLASLPLPSLLLAGLLACTPQAPPEELLADASSQVTFTTVEGIGPHHLVSSVHRTDSRAGMPDLTVDEVVEIAWQDWDNFHVRRLVDGQPERETIVAAGVPWVRSADIWDRRDDAEPHRVQLRTTWNTWEAVLGPWLAHIELVPDGDDIVEGRPASRYQVRMLPADRAPKTRTSAFTPVSAQGTVWLDKATAVHLRAEVEAVARRQGLTRAVRFTLQRANVGEDQGIAAPPG